MGSLRCLRPDDLLMPHPVQMTLLALSAASFAGAGLCAGLALWRERPRLRPCVRILEWLGLLTAAATLGWHVLLRAQTGHWEPFGDNFEALLWVAVLLAGFVAYVQLRRPVPGLEPAMMPLVVLLLLAAAGLELWLPRDYDLRGLGTGIHRITSYAGAACFAVAAIAGAMYLRLSTRLRHKAAFRPDRRTPFSSLERLENWTFTAVTLGFALLTVGMITGLARLDEASGPAWQWSPKIALAVAVWLVYAVVLHAPILPNFAGVRGRKTAWLSVVGFVLMLGTLVAVQWMPGATTALVTARHAAGGVTP